VIAILLFARRIADAPSETRPRFDVVGAVLSAAGLGLLVFGILRSGEWGWIQPKAGAPSWAGLSPTVWLVVGGLFVVWLFSRWEARREARGEEPLVRPGLLRNRQLSGSLLMFFFQYLVQAGLFFVVPLYLSVCLGLSALATGARLLPLSVTLLVAAIGIPRLFPDVSPRLVVRSGLLALLAERLCCSGRSTRTRARRSSSCRCSWSAWRSARSPLSSAASRSPPFRTTRAPRSAACRTR
jgi:Na+/melibiose symporter-like transporter